MKGFIMKTLFFILVMLGFFDAPIAWGKTDCSIHKVYCKIVSLRPDIDKKWAMKFSNIVSKKAKVYKLDPIRSIAIAMQESSIRVINRKQNVLVHNEECDDLGECSTTYEVVKGYSDLSVWMFHIDTLMAYEVDPIKVQNDLDYATDFHFRLLKAKMKRCKHLGDESWSCYHSITERHRQAYMKRVEPYFNKKVSP